ncbi:MAG: hypothetical protein V4642_13940 [Bacteroidota bacterium]
MPECKYKTKILCRNKVLKTKWTKHRRHCYWKHILEAHTSKVAGESEVGKGTVISFTLKR